MKALTLWEPWATLVAHGFKRFETRGWLTSYTGAIAVHAAKKWTDRQEHLCWDEPFARHLRVARARLMGMDAPEESDLSHLAPRPQHRGCILAVGHLVGCHRMDRRFVATVREVYGDDEIRYGDWRPGRYAWEIADPEVLDDPIPWRGQQGLWGLPSDWRNRAPEPERG